MVTNKFDENILQRHKAQFLDGRRAKKKILEKLNKKTPHFSSS